MQERVFMCSSIAELSYGDVEVILKGWCNGSFDIKKKVFI